MPIIKKCKLGPKTVDCIFLCYAIHNVGYRFLIVKSGVPGMHVGTITESRDTLFFENIFPMRDGTNSFRQEFIEDDSSAEPIEHNKPTLVENPEEDNNDALRKSKRQRTVKYTPRTIEEAYSSPDADYWKETVRSEMDSIMSNGTWEDIERPYGCNPVGCKWVFNKKFRPDGTVEKYKAMLVTKGYTPKRRGFP